MLHILYDNEIAGDSGAAAKVGTKAAYLAQMISSQHGIVPPFFVVQPGHKLVEDDKEAIQEAVAAISRHGTIFGDSEKPQFLAVRQSPFLASQRHIPAVLGHGLFLDSYEKGSIITLANWFKSERMALDSAIRFRLGLLAHTLLVNAYGIEVVLMRTLNAQKASRLSEITDPMQLMKLYNALYSLIPNNWQKRQPIDYLMENIREVTETGAPAMVQQMIFSNISGMMSGVGTVYSSNPINGDAMVGGETLMNGYHSDISEGRAIMLGLNDKVGLKHTHTEIYNAISNTAQDAAQVVGRIAQMDFAFMKSKVYVLGVKPARRTAMAQLKSVAARIKSGEDPLSIILDIDPMHIPALMSDTLDLDETNHEIVAGLNASPGVGVGRVATDQTQAHEFVAAKLAFVYVRPFTVPSDITVMIKAKAVVTGIGGATSHAAVLARQFGIPAVTNVGDLNAFQHGAVVSVDGTGGKVYSGKAKVVKADLSSYPEMQEVLDLAASIGGMGVMANADTPEQAQLALDLGAEGIGLCRTEHMFLGERTELLINAIIAQGAKPRANAIAALKALQVEDFAAILRVMKDRPVIVRLLDPPLHEFLPTLEELNTKVEEAIVNENLSEIARLHAIREAVKSMEETNPMMGLRGCRLGIMQPDLISMQIEAICEAVFILNKEGVTPYPKIMVPLVSLASEMDWYRKLIKSIMKKYKLNSKAIPVGAMIETPRAAVTADMLDSDFFSFGTNDLTQMTYALSRDDAEQQFLNYYEEIGLVTVSPFKTIDQQGVGALMSAAIEAASKDMNFGICGEHGGDPDSVDFFESLGLSYVSVSPYRVPLARLAVAQARARTLLGG